MKEIKELRTMVESIQNSTKPEEKDPYADLPQEQREAIDLLDSLLDRQLNKKLSPLLKRVEVEEAGKKLDAVKKQFPGVNDAELNNALDLMEKNSTLALEDAVKIASWNRVKREGSANSKRTEKDQKNKRAFSESAANARTGDDTDYSKMTAKELEEILNVPAHLRVDA